MFFECGIDSLGALGGVAGALGFGGRALHGLVGGHAGTGFVLSSAATARSLGEFAFSSQHFGGGNRAL